MVNARMARWMLKPVMHDYSVPSRLRLRGKAAQPQRRPNANAKGCNSLVQRLFTGQVQTPRYKQMADSARARH